MLPTPGHGDRLAEPGERVASRESFSLEGEPEEKGLTLRQLGINGLVFSDIFR